MNTPRSSNSGQESRDRPMPPTDRDRTIPDTSPDDRPGYGGGMFGYPVNARDAVRDAVVGTAHGRGDRSDAGDEADDRKGDVPIGSALQAAQGMGGSAGARNATADAGGDLASGPNTLGATTGGERAVAGRTDANRNSRDDHSSLGSDGGVI
ncbi:hypothetical protein [Cognatilysobacter bugurensis]|uniref:Uncharacterized protein n=1 Tax=Cognatilysobacter bugurensis TaxID=543356 RepID=A0A918W9B9_9GAMM|nr:hypothetical protein [Lysobacter bugurensis]GHA79514.1 hypothetical protein GCM10007067_16290 [Lysobacter bugurensis]